MRATLLVLAVVFLFLGGLFFLIGGHPLLDAWRYRGALHGESTATGTALRPATETSGTVYEVSYRADLDGRLFERTEAVPVHLWERAEATSRVPVEYLPGRPDTVRIAIDDAAAMRKSFIFTAIGALMILGGLVAATRAMRRARPIDAQLPVSASIAIPTHPSSYWPLARQSPAFWLGAMFLIVSTPLVVATLLHVPKEWQFARHGVATNAMILTKDITRSGRSRSSRTYAATYRLRVPEGAFENRAELPFDTWSRLNERQTAEALYLPERPSTNRLIGSDEWMAAAFLGLIGSVFFAVGATFFHQSIRQAKLEWRLRQRGAIATGVVVEVSDRRLEINGVRQWRLRYEYNDFQSRRHSATHDIPGDEAPLWNVGDAGAVRYDPGRPADSIWLGRSS